MVARGSWTVKLDKCEDIGCFLIEVQSIPCFLYNAGMDDLEESQATLRTAIMEKDALLGVVGLAVSTGFAQVGRFDPRTGEPLTSRWDDHNKARRGFRNMLRSSRANGWNVLYDGPPLLG